MKLELLLIVAIAATATLGTATAAAGGDCDLNLKEVKDCKWNIAATTTIDHDITMTGVTSTCSVNGNSDSCVVLNPDITLTIKSSTFTGIKTARFLEMQQGSHLSMTDVKASHFGRGDSNKWIDGGVLLANRWCTVKLNNVDMTDNIAMYGGCLKMYDGGQLMATDSKFISNIAKSGGAFHLTQSHATITKCQFKKNAAKDPMLGGGGAVTFYAWSKGKDCIITESTFTANTAVVTGGALVIQGVGEEKSHAGMKITKCVFNENVSNSGRNSWFNGMALGDDIYCSAGGKATISDGTKYTGVARGCTGNIV